MHCIPKTFPNLFPDVLPQPNDKARRSHFHDLAVVGNTVKGGMNQQATLAEQGFDVKRHLNVGGIHAFVLQDDGIEFQKF